MLAQSKLPEDYKEALKALLDQLEENEKLRKQIEEMKKSQYPEILQAKHVAEIMGVALSTAYALMKLNDFPGLQLGGVARVRRDSFFRWLDANERKASGG